MKMVAEIIRPCNSTVAVIDPKKGDLLLLDAGFGEIGDDADSVLVVGEDRSAVRVGGVGLDDSIAFG